MGVPVKTSSPMRGIGCFVSWYRRNGTLQQCENTSCWAGIYDFPAGREIYIGNYDCDATREFQELLISIINEVTPCSVYYTKGKYYIKFLLLKGYDKNLVLLNFIRNLWFEPTLGYTKKFFTALQKSGEVHSDPVSRLTWTNKEACTDSVIYGGHSNVHPKGKLCVRTTKQLLNYTFTSTAFFLTNDYC